jgi:hypothetical protein
MRPSPLSYIRIQGNKKKPPVSWRKIGITIVVLIVLGGSGYLLLFSSVFAIREIKVQDFSRLASEDVLNHLQSLVDTRQWGMQPYRDILLFNAVHAEQELTARFPSLKDVRVIKRYLHTVEVTGEERIPLGIWCRQDACKYFDDEGVTWGNAIGSSGALLTVVRDNRNNAPPLDRKFLSSIQLVVKRLPELGVALKSFEIPADALNEFRVHTGAGYDVIFALDSNVAKQLEVLRIFLDNKQDDPTFHPEEYIDLRIEGRVYYDKGVVVTSTPSVSEAPEAAQ